MSKKRIRLSAFALAVILGAGTITFPVNATNEYKDGKYVGTGDGYNGNIQLEVSIEQNKITSITEVSQTETKSFWKKAKVLLNTIVEEQSVEVDSVSGATISSNGIKQAVVNALKQAEVTGETEVTEETATTENTKTNEDANVSDIIPEDIFEKGNGTVENPYIISNAKQLRAFAKSLNEKIDYMGKTVALSQDIDVSDAAWTPIGGSEYLFNGTFEGNQHVIRGMQLGANDANYVLSSQERYIGLFGLLGEHAKVQNLGIENVQFYIESTASAYVGTLAGYSNGAVIDSCYATGTVSAKAGKSNNFAGGLVSYMYNGAVINSYTEVSVSCETTDGIAEAAGITALNNRGIIANCYTLGNAYASADRAKEGMACVSGLVAVEAGTQVNCAAYGNITTGEYSYYAGMLAGWVTGIGKVYQCYYNSDASMKIGEQTPDPITDIGTIISAGINDEGEPYSGGIAALNEAVKASDMQSSKMAEKLNANAASLAADVAAWNLATNALYAFSYTEGDAHICLSDKAITVTYVQPEAEKQDAKPETNYIDGVYYGRDSKKEIVVKVQITGGNITDITCLQGCTEEEETIKQQIIKEQKVTGTTAYEEAVSKALEKMLSGDTTDYEAFDGSKFDGGNGTQESPYQISKQEQLAYLANALNEDTTCEGMYFALTKDISLLGEWKPIGTAKYPFKGNFNGNGHTVSNMSIGTEKAPANYELCGFFGYCNGSAKEGQSEGIVIQNLHLENVSIYNQNTERSYAAAIAGGADYGVTIKNCKAKGEITVQSDEKIACAGGLAGQHMKGLMLNSSSDITICVTSGKNWVYGGGLIGMSNRATVVNCYANGNVTGTAGAANKASIGGLLGMCGGIIVNCYASGDTVSTTVTGDVGGLCGRLTGIAALYHSYYNAQSVQKNGNTVNEVNVSCGTKVDGCKEESVEGMDDTKLKSEAFVQKLNANAAGISEIMTSVEEHLQGLTLEHTNYYDGSVLYKWVLDKEAVVLEEVKENDSTTEAATTTAGKPTTEAATTTQAATTEATKATAKKSAITVKKGSTYTVNGMKYEELSSAIMNINQILDTINESQKELDDAVHSVNDNLQQITYASENVAEETKEVRNSIVSLQTTMEQFNV